MTPKIQVLAGGHSQVAGRACAPTPYPFLITGLSGKVTPRTDAARKSGSARCLASPLNQAGRGGGSRALQSFPECPLAPQHTYSGTEVSQEQSSLVALARNMAVEEKLAVSISSGGSPPERRKRKGTEGALLPHLSCCCTTPRSPGAGS